MVTCGFRAFIPFLTCKNRKTKIDKQHRWVDFHCFFHPKKNKREFSNYRYIPIDMCKSQTSVQSLSYTDLSCMPRKQIKGEEWCLCGLRKRKGKEGKEKIKIIKISCSLVDKHFVGWQWTILRLFSRKI